MNLATTIPVQSDPQNKTVAVVILVVFAVCLLLAVFKNK